MIIDRKKWFAENQWYLKAIENGEEVEFSNFTDFRGGICSIPSGFDLNRSKCFSGPLYSYCYARPIPKKKMRMMTREEIAIFQINHPRALAIYGSDYVPVIGCLPSSLLALEYIEVPEGYHGDFSDLEVKKFETEVKE